MPFDGFFARAVAAELQALEGAKVERVNHNAKEYVELCLYLPGAGRRTLVISVCPSDARIALVDGEESRAAVPTMFCMLLRKHLQSARIRSVCALPNERVLAFELEGFDELGHSETKRIYAEIMGKYSNLFLCDGGDRILGALHTTDITAKTRRIFAGAPYERPPAQDKRDALSADRAGFLALARENEGMPADRFLLTHFLAFSPLTAREVAFRALGAVDAPLDAAGAERLWTAFNALCRDIAGGRFTPSLLTGPDGRMVDFSFTPIMQYGSGYTCTDCGSFSALQNTFFAAKSAENHKKQFSADLSRTLAAARARTEKKLAAQRAELADCARMDEYRRTGDLITSNLYRLKQGDTRVTLHDYETDAEVAVTLDGRLSPSKNAQRYYKKYAKAKHAQAVLTEQIGLAERELEYLSSVQDALARAETERDFAELRQELTVAGLCGDRRAPKNGKKGGRPLPSKPLAFTLTSGRTVRVGKNNLQNDALTFGADKTDIWFHVKGFPGSHAVLFTDGAEPTDLDYTESAMLAAYHSKASGGVNVQVDYTPVRYVKKPAGAKPGFVVYDRYFTAVVRAELPDGVRAQKK